MEHTYCSKCNTYRPNAAFYTSINRSWCIECRKEYSRASYASMDSEQRAMAVRIAKIKRASRRTEATA